MRILLATAVAIAPLLAASGAMAEVVISTTRTTPITTSNATGSGADSIRLATNGAINVSSGAAVTVDSSHNFTMDGGTVTMASAADGSTAVLVNPGVTTTLNIGSAIVVSDTIGDYTDTDNDGDVDGDWATGSGRYGVRYAPGGTVTGDLLIGQGGSITVDGNASYGISLESNLTGRLLNRGNIRVFGDDTVGIRTTGAISGDFMNVGGVLARGEDATAISVGGDVAGRLSLQGDINVTGYRYTTRGSQAFIDKLDPNDLLQAGPAVIVAADVGGGIVIDRPPADAVATNPDEDNDGVPDAAENIGAVTIFGEAPAIQIGSESRGITIGVVGTGDNAFGFINRGAINGNGVYDGIDANGVVVGNTGQTVQLNGGFRNESTITTLSAEGQSTAVRLGDGASTPLISNTGTITAGVTGDVATATATAIRIDDDAVVPALNNNGSIVAVASGGVSSVTAVLDLSGTLTSITNTKSIQASVTPNLSTGALTGTATAIDVRNNTSGVTVLQNGITGTPSATNPDSDGDGVPNDNEPVMVGNVLLGSGADLFDIRNGTVTGDISFGGGADTLSISGGAVVTGALSDSGGDLAINIANGTLDARQTAAMNVTSMNIGGDGTLIVSVDPETTTNTGFIVSGTATLADGASLGMRFNSLLQDPTERFTLIDAGTLNLGNVDLSSVAENSPFLYVVQAGADVPNGLVYADVRRRTAEEAGMIPVEASMYDSFYTALGIDGAENIRDAFLAQTGRDDFINLYEQLLPDHSGGPLVSLASGVDAVTRALTGRNAAAAPGETSAWVQEINFYADKERTDTYGFRSEGFGVAGGVERGTGLGALGFSVAFTSSDLEDPEAEAEEVLSASLLELGLYWRAQGQYWTTWARAAAGYASFESERRLVGAGLNLTTTSDWNGLTLAAAAGASYEREFGRFSVRPEIYAEYFSLSEDGHSEEGGGDGFDLEIDDRDGHLFSATAAINVSMAMGETSWLRPELRLGWRQNLSVDPGETIARFRNSTGPDFILSPDTIEGGGPIVGFRLNVGNELGMLSVSADAEMLDNYVRYMLFLRASFRF
ncbi:autotransporter outer membrane beta-barrel domain-containing protein [Brevundimonas lenta]|uniref:Autotransporter domain-containing protein n=1 Tax=Brevundimonas lenta TaxID=424796 RepID=A0A7W6NPI2_9CAUL|nr:autotransporter outer membrane beta-barrel domain-containing protein [Brevundimonas lenta]MBB4083445.1 hypothetical protein [Brevundimonas lenta]